jgi:hypothetical protein
MIYIRNLIWNLSNYSTTTRSAFNLAYQHLSRVPEKPTCLCELSGSDLIGLPLKSPLAFNETIFTGCNNEWELEWGGGGRGKNMQKYSKKGINDSDVFILTARSAFNLAYQHLSRVPEKSTCLCELSGSDLIGLPLKSPLAFNETIFTGCNNEWEPDWGGGGWGRNKQNYSKKGNGN